MSLTARIQNVWQSLVEQDGQAADTGGPPAPGPVHEASMVVDIAPNDPVVAYFQAATGVVWTSTR